jgi:hypothetical protein
LRTRFIIVDLAAIMPRAHYGPHVFTSSLETALQMTTMLKQAVHHAFIGRRIADNASSFSSTNLKELQLYNGFKSTTR